MVYSWMADPKNGFANLHLTISPGAHVDLPIFGLAFANFGIRPWGFVDSVPRRNLATNCDYHDQVLRLDQRPLAADPPREPPARLVHLAHGLHPRRSPSRTAFCYSGPDGAEDRRHHPGLRPRSTSTAGSAGGTTPSRPRSRSRAGLAAAAPRTAPRGRGDGPGQLRGRPPVRPGHLRHPRQRAVGEHRTLPRAGVYEPRRPARRSTPHGAVRSGAPSRVPGAARAVRHRAPAGLLPGACRGHPTSG